MKPIMRALRPPLLALIAIAISACVLLTLCLRGEIPYPAVSYFAYLYSTYALCIVCVRAVELLRSSKDKIASWLSTPEEETSLVWLRHILTDAHARTRALLLPSLLLNLGYAAFKLCTGVWLRSDWLVGVGLYYAVLAVLRFTLLRSLALRRKNENSTFDRRTYRRVAVIMLVLTLVMAALIAQLVLTRRAYDYPGVLIYAFALYAFVKIITAVTAMTRSRAEDSWLLAAARALSFACALMSILALQTALISRFGDTAFADTANALTGAVVCAIMLMLCIAMLYRSGAGSGKT